MALFSLIQWNVKLGKQSLEEEQTVLDGLWKGSVSSVKGEALFLEGWQGCKKGNAELSAGKRNMHK